MVRFSSRVGTITVSFGVLPLAAGLRPMGALAKSAPVVRLRPGALGPGLLTVVVGDGTGRIG
jgi:hypothetical protein